MRRYGLIGSVVLVMVLFVMIFGRLLLPAPETSSDKKHGRVTADASPEKGLVQEGELPFNVQQFSGREASERLGNRTLEDFYGNRQYPGGPPRIPHPVEEQFQNNGENQCKSCHAEGGYVDKYLAYAPKTPHEELSACQQCHVPQRTGELFRENTWSSVRPPDLGQSALPGSPPPIPHRMLMRRNCND
ncbi:MAG: nitrate reductase cytochrome c-type subunit [bacterium]